MASELVKQGLMTFVVTVEEDYTYLVDYKTKAYSLRDALQRLGIELKRVKNWEVR